MEAKKLGVQFPLEIRKALYQKDFYFAFNVQII